MSSLPDNRDSISQTNCTMTHESDPLLNTSSKNGNYYFLNKADPSYQGGLTASVRDTDGGTILDEAPLYSSADEFAPRPIGTPVVRFY